MKNCLTYYPWNWRYYLKKPWKFFEDTWLNIKAAWQRATQGWANRDIWNLYDYLLEILPEMIDHLREQAYGWPGEYQGFPTPEDWDKFLKEEIIIPLRNARESQTTQINEYEEELLSYPLNFVKQENGFTALDFTEPEELRRKWLKEKKKLTSGGRKNLNALSRRWQNIFIVFGTKKG